MPPVVTTVVGPLVVNAPLVAALVVCLVVTLQRRAQDPGGAPLVVVGLGLAFLSVLFLGGLQVFSGVLSATHAGAGGWVPTIYTVADVTASLLSAAGWILAAVALVRARRAPAYGQPPDREGRP